MQLVCAPLQKSERNLRRALLMLETCRVLQNPHDSHPGAPAT